MDRIPPSKRIRKEIEELLREGYGGEDLLSTVLQKGMQLIMQEMLEAEVTEFLGRGHYERQRRGEAHKGYRNGYEPMKVRTGEGSIGVEVPQVRDSSDPYCSKLKRFFRGNTECLQRLAAEMYARGLSTRDIEDALVEATGDIVLSRSSVSRVTEVLWEEYEAFKSRDLSGYEVEYLFLDAIYESVRKMAGIKEAILVGWGVLRDGRKVLLSMGLGNRESYEAWLEFLRDMVGRGLRVPLSVTSDGAPGCIKAIEAVFPKTMRLRCWVHRMRNLWLKVPGIVWPEIKAEIVEIRDASSYEQGRRLAEGFIQRHKKRYPTLVKAFEEDLEALLGHLRLPVRHRKTVRTTNLIERSFVEERRRTKVIPGFLTEQSCLKLVFSVLMRASRRWQRVKMGEMELKQIDALREQLGLDPVTEGTEGIKEKEAIIA
jgi:transposase-like protein